MEGNAIISIFLISLVLIGIVVVAIALVKTAPVVVDNMANFNSTVPTSQATQQMKTYSVFSNNVIVYAAATATAFIILAFVILAVKNRGS